MLLLIITCVISAVCATKLNYRFVGEKYDPNPLPESIWKQVGGGDNYFPHPGPRYMPSVTLPRPRIVNPRNSYVDYYYRNLRNSYGYDNGISHQGGGYSYGNSQNYGTSYGGGHSYGNTYGGDQSYGNYYGNDQSYGASNGKGQSYGNTFSYGGPSRNNYHAYSSGGNNDYGHGPQSYSYGSQMSSHRGGVRTVFAPQLSGMMKHVRMSDMIGKEFDVRGGGKARVNGMRRGRGVTIMHMDMLRQPGHSRRGNRHSNNHRNTKYWMLQKHTDNCIIVCKPWTIGKGPCDRKSSHIKLEINRYVNEGHNVLDAKRMKQAIDSRGNNTYMCKVVEECETLKPTVTSIPNITS